MVAPDYDYSIIGPKALYLIIKALTFLKSTVWRLRINRRVSEARFKVHGLKVGVLRSPVIRLRLLKRLKALAAKKAYNAVCT